MENVRFFSTLPFPSVSSYTHNRNWKKEKGRYFQERKPIFPLSLSRCIYPLIDLPLYSYTYVRMNATKVCPSGRILTLREIKLAWGRQIARKRTMT